MAKSGSNLMSIDSIKLLVLYMSDFDFLVSNRVFDRRLDKIKLSFVGERVVVTYLSMNLSNANIV